MKEDTYPIRRAFVQIRHPPFGLGVMEVEEGEVEGVGEEASAPQFSCSQCHGQGLPGHRTLLKVLLLSWPQDK